MNVRILIVDVLIWVNAGSSQDEKGVEQVFYELWKTDNKTLVAYDQFNTRYTSKFQSLKPTSSNLKLPSGSYRFQLVLPENKTVEDLRFGSLESFILESNQVEIQIKATALNSRNVFSILKPTDYFKNTNTIGFDFAGVVKRVGSQVSTWSVGDHVFGLNGNQTCLPSHLKLDESDIIRVPQGMSFCEACTLPAAVKTSYHCLIDITRITAEDSVLIHTATGGFGLTAIQICQSVGATIFATAGSIRKQNYLKSLGIKHVFHSRNTKFCNEILQVTNGRGVDVVLNSLTRDGFKEATLKVCAKNARFVEMSKISIWEPEDVKKLRPDVNYTIFDLPELGSRELRRLLNRVEDLVIKKTVKPIPYVRFDAVQIRDALGYLQKAEHIGKIVCVMPELIVHNGKTKIYTPMFNENSTYLITGGLGGIGYAVCEWMVEMGARHIILAGRKPPSKFITDSVTTLKTTKGPNIIPVQLDVSNFHECEQLIKVKIGEMGLPPLKGVMHAAGTLANGLIENQNWEKLSSTFKAKVDGTLNLHRLTENLNLEHFVMFSSLAAIFGNPGQSNHSAGCIFQDTLAHYRHSIGLPAVSINWGQWGQVGIVTEVDVQGVKPLSTLQALTGLEYALKCQRTQTCILNIDSFVMLQKLLPNSTDILDECLWKVGASNKVGTTANVNLTSDEFWLHYDSLQTYCAKLEMLHEKLKNVLRNTLRLDDADVIEDNTTFEKLGVDSLMFVEIKNAVQILFGNRKTLSATALKNSNTIKMLSDTIIETIEGRALNDDTPRTK